jgi:hypothetical protein
LADDFRVVAAVERIFLWLLVAGFEPMLANVGGAKANVPVDRVGAEKGEVGAPVAPP